MLCNSYKRYTAFSNAFVDYTMKQDDLQFQAVLWCSSKPLLAEFLLDSVMEALDGPRSSSVDSCRSACTTSFSSSILDAIYAAINAARPPILRTHPILLSPGVPLGFCKSLNMKLEPTVAIICGDAIATL